MNDSVLVVEGMSLAELKRLKRIEFVLNYSQLHHLKERNDLDSALANALDKQLVEIVVFDDYKKRTKTLVVYPYGESPPEDSGRLIRHESQTSSKPERTQSHETQERLLEASVVGDTRETVN